MKKFVNLTAHPVNIMLDGGDKITFPASGTIARVGMDQVKVGDIDGIPVFRTVFSKDITDLPAPADEYGLHRVHAGCSDSRWQG